MRRLSVLTLCACLIFACNKTSTPDPHQTLSDSSGILTGYIVEQPQESHVFKETLRYDHDGNLIGLSYQSENSNPSPYLDSGTFSFTYDTVTKLISAYSFRGRKTDDTLDNVENHLLLYDNQKQVLEDSTTYLNGILLRPSILTRFSYSDQLAVSKTNDRIDSLTIISGNVTREAFYAYDNTKVYPDYTDLFSPNSNFTNPFYNEKTPVTIRTFLTLIWFNDWVSKDLPDWLSEKITWTKDSKGRVASGIGDAGSKITYVYQ